MKDKIKDILIRTVKTFFQAALATLTVELNAAEISDDMALKTIGIAALSAGVCAVMNMFIALLNKGE